MDFKVIKVSEGSQSQQDDIYCQLEHKFQVYIRIQQFGLIYF